jgi:peptidoglycan/LPS O-acetylase OafA/YrhL
MLKYFNEAKTKFYADIDEVPIELASTRYRSIDGLRGVAILMVTLAHIGVNHFIRPFHLYVDSRIGVNLFFVISGFLITTLLIKEKIKAGRISLGNFYIRRILRILPLAYFFLIVVLLLNLYYNLKIPWSDFTASFLFFKNLPVKNVPLTAHFWTLAVEEQFYITFPFLLVADINKCLIAALSTIIVVSLVSILGFYHLVPDIFPGIHLVIKVIMYAFWKGPVMILLGAVFAILLFKGMVKTTLASNNYFFGFFLFVLAVLIQTKSFIAYRPYISECLSGILFSYSIAISLNSNNLLATILKNEALVGIGLISYSIYVWQGLFLGMYAWEPWLSPLNQLPLYAIFIIKLVVIFITAFFSYYYLESWVLRFRTRFRPSFVFKKYEV